MNKLLLHTCCAPCLCAVLPALGKQSIEVASYFYNPNIHPLLEFRRRLSALKQLQEIEQFSLTADEEYGLGDFLRETENGEQNRCETCYRMRLSRVAELAKREAYEAFSTTLLASPMQKHDVIKGVGEEVSVEIGLPFYYEDFRPGYQTGLRDAKKRMIYRQQYCGCIFSEYDRYRNTTKCLYPANK